MSQTPGGLRAHEAELIDRRAHSVQGGPGHALGVVENVRDRADRDAGPLSDIAHRRMSHGTPPHHASLTDLFCSARRITAFGCVFSEKRRNRSRMGGPDGN